MTNWVYLFVYDNRVGSYDYIKAILNSMPEVLNWIHCLPNSFFVVSDRTAAQLTQAFDSRITNKGMFVFADVSKDIDGRLAREQWDFINNPKTVFQETDKKITPANLPITKSSNDPSLGQLAAMLRRLQKENKAPLEPPKNQAKTLIEILNEMAKKKL